MESTAWLFPWWPLIVVAVVWEAVWKGIALWRAARNGHMVWYIFIFIINSVGILPIVYIFGFSNRRTHKLEGK